MRRLVASLCVLLGAAASARAQTGAVTAEGQVEVGAEVELDAQVELQPAFPVHVEYGFDFGLGAADGDAPMQGFAGRRQPRPVHCRAGIDIGASLRLGVGPDNDRLATLALVIGGARGSRPGALGRSLSSCDR
jgi:hypothetical protein